MMKQDYNKIAEVLSGLHIGTLANTCMGGFVPSITGDGFHCETLIDSLCDLFASENPNFNKKKFIEACGFVAWTELVMGVPVFEE